MDDEQQELIEKLKKLAVEEINKVLKSKILSNCPVCEGSAIICSLRMINKINSYQVCCSQCLIHAPVGDSVENAIASWDHMKKLIDKIKQV